MVVTRRIHTEQPVSYTIYKEGSLTKAMNGDTGAIDQANTDSATVIQYAIDALTSGGHIYIKQGEYVIGTTIQLDDYIVISGAGYGTRISCTTDDIDIFYINVKSNVKFMNLRVDGPNSGTGACIHFHGQAFCTVQNCYIIHGGSAGGLQFSQIGGSTSGNDLIAGNIIRQNNGYGIDLTRQHDTKVIGNLIEDNDLTNIYSYLSSSLVLQGNETSGSVTGSGIDLANSPRTSIIGGWADVNKVNGIKLGPSSYNCKIVGSTVDHNGQHGINLDHCNGVSVI